MVDVGIHVDDPTAYPHVAVTAATTISSGEADRGILICGTGLDMAIAADEVTGIRTVRAHDTYSVKISVLNNEAQILCMGQQVVGSKLARKLVTEWLNLESDQTSSSATKVRAISE